jgi:hypothetical protein
MVKGKRLGCYPISFSCWLACTRVTASNPRSKTRAPVVVDGRCCQQRQRADAESVPPPSTDIWSHSVLPREPGHPERDGAKGPKSDDHIDSDVADDEPRCSARDQTDRQRDEEQPRLAVPPEGRLVSGL